MKVLHFEPWLWKDITDYPDLGTAMLMGAYKLHSIPADLVCTQSVYIEELFLERTTQLKSLYFALPDDVKLKYQQLGASADDFKKTMKELYHRYYSHRWMDYFDAKLTMKFKLIFNLATNMQFEALKLGLKHIPIVDILSVEILQLLI
jgi:hypothetical protein